MSFFKGSIFDTSEPSVEERLRVDEPPPVRRRPKPKPKPKPKSTVKLGRIKHKSRPASIKTDPKSVRKMVNKKKVKIDYSSGRVPIRYNPGDYE